MCESVCVCVCVRMKDMPEWNLVGEVEPCHICYTVQPAFYNHSGVAHIEVLKQLFRSASLEDASVQVTLARVILQVQGHLTWRICHT